MILGSCLPKGFAIAATPAVPCSYPARQRQSCAVIFHQLIAFTASELYSLILDHLDFYLLKEARHATIFLMYTRLLSLALVPVRRGPANYLCIFLLCAFFPWILLLYGCQRSYATQWLPRRWVRISPATVLQIPKPPSFPGNIFPAARAGAAQSRAPGPEAATCSEPPCRPWCR